MDIPNIPQGFLSTLTQFLKNREQDENDITESLGAIHGDRAVFTYLACCEVMDTLNMTVTMAAASGPPPMIMSLLAHKAMNCISGIVVAGLEGFDEKSKREVSDIINAQMKKRTENTMNLVKGMRLQHPPSQND